MDEDSQCPTIPTLFTSPRATRQTTFSMVRFAPLRIPLKRRLQTLAVLMFGLAPMICLIAFMTMCFFFSVFFACLYGVYFLFTFRAYKQAGPQYTWLRCLCVWICFVTVYAMICVEMVSALVSKHGSSIWSDASGCYYCKHSIWFCTSDVANGGYISAISFQLSWKKKQSSIQRKITYSDIILMVLFIF